MNTYTLFLSSPATAYATVLPQISLDDHTRFILDAQGLAETTVPIYVKIDWGDSSMVLHDNPFAFANNLNIVRFSTLLNAQYTHDYLPSSTALYKLLSAQVMVKYSNSNMTHIVIPLKIRTYGYMESIGDMSLANTNILPVEGNPSEHQIRTSKDDYIVELRNG